MLVPEPDAVPPLVDVAATDGMAGPAVRLRVEMQDLGVAERVRPGETVEVAYHWRWRAGTADTSRLVAFVHSQDERGRFGDDHRIPPPIGGLGDGPQHLAERRRVAVPPDLAPGPCRVVLGVLDPGSGRRLQRWRGGVLPAGAHTVGLGTLQVAARP